MDTLSWHQVRNKTEAMMTLTGESSDFDFYYYSQKLKASLSDLEAELNGKLISLRSTPFK